MKHGTRLAKDDGQAQSHRPELPPPHPGTHWKVSDLKFGEVRGPGLGHLRAAVLINYDHHESGRA